MQFLRDSEIVDNLHVCTLTTYYRIFVFVCIYIIWKNDKISGNSITFWYYHYIKKVTVIKNKYSPVRCATSLEASFFLFFAASSWHSHDTHENTRLITIARTLISKIQRSRGTLHGTLDVNRARDVQLIISRQDNNAETKHGRKKPTIHSALEIHARDW